jgi:gamma-glutamyltranspeptidase/glutathione hydrolase
MRRHANLLTLLTLATVMTAADDASGQDVTLGPRTMARRSTVYAPHAAIATAQPLATAAGLAVMQRGGNAFDAAVTAAAVLNVVEPQMTGIGGDMFAIAWSAKDRKLVALNASGRAGALMTRAELIKRGRTTIPGKSAESITVPGALSGWAALLERYGTIDLAHALEPAIRIAEEGFPVTPVISREWASELEHLKNDEGARTTFLINGDHTPVEGEWFRNPDLAKSFRTIAAQGPGALYGGSIGEQLVYHVQKLGGFLTIDDMKNHHVDWVEPISTTFKGYRVWEMPPNNQGVAVLEMLRILDSYDLAALGHNTAPYLHLLIEAKKLAFADLDQFIGDPASMRIQTNRLLADDFIAQRRSLIDRNKAAEHVEPGPERSLSETTYFTVADKDGNMISFINSNFAQFGSGVVVPGLGFALQNRGSGFTLKPDMPNTVAPGKRPFHTLIPGFVTKPDANGVEQPYMSFGVMGGGMQPQGHVQVLLNLFVFKMGLQEALDAPRFRHIAGKHINLEPAIGDDVRRQMTLLGHEIGVPEYSQFGGAQAIMKLARGYAAASEPRKDGMAAGW